MPSQSTLLLTLKDAIEEKGYKVYSISKVKGGVYIRTDTGSFKLTKDYQPEALTNLTNLISILGV